MSGQGISNKKVVPASDAPIEEIRQYNSKTFEAFLGDLSRDRNNDQKILKEFSEDDNAIHKRLFNEIASEIGFRKKKLNICIEAIEQKKEKLLKEKSLQQNEIESNILQNEINYNIFFLSLAKEEMQREELFKEKAMKIILAKCIYHGFEKEEDSSE